MPSLPLDSTHKRQRRAWHSITALGQHTRSDDVGRGMTSPPFDNTHGRQRRAWHAIIAFGQHTRSNDVGRGMPKSPLGSTLGRTTSGVACNHHHREAHTIERRRAWNDITAFGQHTQSNDVEREMPSPPLDSTLGRMTSGVACHHRHWAVDTVERRRA